MFELRTLLILIPTLPLLAAVLTATLGPRLLKSSSHGLTILALAGSFLCSLGVAGAVSSRSSETLSSDVGFEYVTEPIWTWVNIPDAYTTADGTTFPFVVDVALRADGLTAMMLPMVTLIAMLVAIYGAGYMHGDRSYWRFFSYVSLFVFSMTMLVVASNFLLLFVFWEAVGVCSYLLIGFWYEKEEAASAGKKAFLVNRVGDFGLMLAIFLIWITYGSLNFHDTDAVAGVLGQQRLQGALPFVGGGIATATCLLLLVGACGKSAQFPLHVWLPDAMEGPTPVSALIHAATMVTAGVYMVARCAPLFHASPTAQLILACVGGFTALLAGLIALTQFDLKRVLAYSTISQLGYMFLALGTGSVVGLIAGMFHLLTHAFFKALLFLGAGSVMHAMGNVIDMRRFGGLRHVMPWTHRTFLVGCLALSGVFPLAGFWSKDEVLVSVHEQAWPDDDHSHPNGAMHQPHSHATQPVALNSSSATTLGGVPDSICRPCAFRLLYIGGLLSAFLTAFYTFRAYFMTFFGAEVIPTEAGHHAHESPRLMVVPLIILAIFSFGVGWLFLSASQVGSFLATAPSIAFIQGGRELHFEIHGAIAGMSILVALLGIGAAAFLYLGHRHEAKALAERLWPLRALSYHKFFVDELYQYAVVWPLRLLAEVSYLFDQWLVDGLVNLGAKLPLWLGTVARRLQRGLVPFYGLMMAVGAIIILGLGGLWWFGD